ncbi:prohead protease [Pseudomonas phage VW-6B]|nr:prohead protease [Pseudomonas phage VW-6B]
MATPKKKDKPEEKFIKDSENLTSTDTAVDDDTNAGTNATAGDTTNTGTDATAGDTANTSTDATAGDATNAGTDATAGDGTNASTDATAGDAINAGTETGSGDVLITVDNDAGSLSGLINTVSGEKAALDFIRSSAKKPEVDTDAKPNWFTVQVVRSPSGKRFRAGIEFTAEPKPYDFSLLSDEQIAAISADSFLRIKPIAPAGE